MGRKHIIRIKYKTDRRKWYYLSSLNQYHIGFSPDSEEKLEISDNWIEIALALIKAKYRHGDIVTFQVINVEEDNG